MLEYEVSEAVARGHPDKLADQIADAILDHFLEQDPYSRVAVEAMVAHHLIAVGGEVTSQGHVNVEDICRQVLSKAGYENLASTVQIVSSITCQSPDIAHGVGESKELFSSIRAGDQGMMFGYASLDTPNYMPKSYEIAREIVFEIEKNRAMDNKCILEPDGKTEVALFKEAAAIVVSWQHREEAVLDEVQAVLAEIVRKVSERYSVRIIEMLLNPAGRFVLGGPLADTGLTGRKQIVDSYGSSVHHGGGSYSGKDATKVDRSGAYMARYMAKHVVAAGLAARCEVELIFSIGQEKPLCIGIDCFGTETIPEYRILEGLEKVFPLSVSGIILELDLTNPIFSKTSYGGHFGRDEFRWEQLSRLTELKSQISLF